jgi:hypothetical protein
MLAHNSVDGIWHEAEAVYMPVGRQEIRPHACLCVTVMADSPLSAPLIERTPQTRPYIRTADPYLPHTTDPFCDRAPYMQR